MLNFPCNIRCTVILCFVILLLGCVVGQNKKQVVMRSLVPEDLMQDLYQKYREAVEDDSKPESLRRLFKQNKEYSIHVQKLQEVNGFKKHNLMIKEANGNNPFIYINNPVESYIPNAFLTIEEFKTALTNRVKLLRSDVVNTNGNVKNKLFVSKLVTRYKPTRTPSGTLNVAVYGYETGKDTRLRVKQKRNSERDVTGLKHKISRTAKHKMEQKPTRIISISGYKHRTTKHDKEKKAALAKTSKMTNIINLNRETIKKVVMRDLIPKKSKMRTSKNETVKRAPREKNSKKSNVRTIKQETLKTRNVQNSYLRTIKHRTVKNAARAKIVKNTNLRTTKHKTVKKAIGSKIEKHTNLKITDQEVAKTKKLSIKLGNGNNTKLIYNTTNNAKIGMNLSYETSTVGVKLLINDSTTPVTSNSEISNDTNSIINDDTNRSDSTTISNFNQTEENTNTVKQMIEDQMSSAEKDDTIASSTTVIPDTESITDTKEGISTETTTTESTVVTFGRPAVFME